MGSGAEPQSPEAYNNNPTLAAGEGVYLDRDSSGDKGLCMHVPLKRISVRNNCKAGVRLAHFSKVHGLFQYSQRFNVTGSRSFSVDIFLPLIFAQYLLASGYWSHSHLNLKDNIRRNYKMTNDTASSYSDEYKVIRNHPYVIELLDSGNYEVNHAYDVPDDQKDHSLTAGTLIGKDLISHTPLALFLRSDLITERQESELIVFYHLGSRLCGHKGIIHGGLLATLIDETFCRCGFPLLPNKLGVTATLDIQYLAPTKAESIIVVRAKTTKVEGRKVWIEGAVSALPYPDAYESGHELTPAVKAKVLLVEPRWVEKLPKFSEGKTELATEEGTSEAQQQQPTA
ncbi:hypothetical protein AWJ20_3937 [Sugiyamaella lignohabitans]|uniref:Thioesterase domain-containing protein n=1 Tax=Sugiyamaella lignohabitans TaxID=796027 RepID=A0A161HIS6_9ASCO|nr:uncharacterized protein AWJ20_3937 [Sugiyamaella lignohabitans]ANB11138.1 hypothetical protein AWJ20_3937 [Sugiyamaella lignohabitans]